MSLDAMKLALEALEFLALENFVELDKSLNVGPTHGRKAIIALRAAIEQEHEPVECMCGICKLGKREWQGLTDEEVSEILDREIGFNSCFGPETDFARAIEAKLKEKNT